MTEVTEVTYQGQDRVGINRVGRAPVAEVDVFVKSLYALGWRALVVTVDDLDGERVVGGIVAHPTGRRTWWAERARNPEAST